MSDLDTVFNDTWPDDHRSGIVAVVGRPNVGKSTLINAILGQKIAIVTPKPQTTQRQQLGIYTVEHGQILFLDTPGLHTPHHKLGEFMVSVAEDALRDSDIILWVLDVSQAPEKADILLAERIRSLSGDTPVMLVLNKVDLLTEENREALVAAHQSLIPHEEAFLLSALNNADVDKLISNILERLPEGPRYYPADQISEVNMRFMAAEAVREKVMLNTEQEIPHTIAVEIESFKERSDNMTYISAVIYVERDSQKGIIIGKGGSMIKRIGSEARQEIAAAMGTKVFLDLRVKVLKNWRSDEKLMRRLGYRLPKNE
ncbi:MAG: GTPase Era [Anaerolineae bacterium]|nr:GTPase Era [Anaerolineae bacterium]